MYYYIFDPPQGAKEYERTAQIKELLSNLGIAGEMTSPIPGKAVEDLVQLAVAKRYSTIVAVGGMELINRIARAIEPHDIVFGIIPSMEHPDITELIGVSDWKSAAEQLKRRRWQSVKLGLINGETCFLTAATIMLEKDQVFELVAPGFTIKGMGGMITINPLRNSESASGLVVDIEPLEAPKKGLFSSLFGKKTEMPEESHFTVPKFTLRTNQSQPVWVANTSLAQTPITCTTQEKSLKLIVGKGVTSV
jgi:hypothetical protein